MDARGAVHRNPVRATTCGLSRVRSMQRRAAVQSYLARMQRPVGDVRMPCSRAEAKVATLPFASRCRCTQAGSVIA
eukprot:2465208-Alexandrium_andersonii.AAC.1